MSEKKTIIEITPEATAEREAIVVGPMRCPCCHGAGGYDNLLKHPSEARETCGRCRGTGEVKAIVTVDWRCGVAVERQADKTCCICGGEINGYGNNALPVKEGECCDACNWQVVIPERLRISRLGNTQIEGK